MSPLPDRFQTLVQFLQHNLPAEAVPPALPTGIVALLFGVTLCVLGAKLARWFVAVSFVVLGLLGGLTLSRMTGLSPLMCALFGGISAGGLGFALHRLLVGGFAAVFLAGLAFSVFSTEKVLPHLQEFERMREIPAGVQNFQPGPPSDIAASSWNQFNAYCKQFGDYLVDKEPNVRKYAIVLVLGAGLAGLLMGIFLCRLTLILFTAAFGTSLIASGLSMAGPALNVDVYSMSQNRPALSALSLGAFFVASILLQAALTRPEMAPPVARRVEDR
jgi:MFS family permease